MNNSSSSRQINQKEIDSDSLFHSRVSLNSAIRIYNDSAILLKKKLGNNRHYFHEKTLKPTSLINHELLLKKIKIQFIIRPLIFNKISSKYNNVEASSYKTIISLERIIKRHNKNNDLPSNINQEKIMRTNLLSIQIARDEQMHISEKRNRKSSKSIEDSSFLNNFLNAKLLINFIQIIRLLKEVTLIKFQKHQLLILFTTVLQV